MCAEVTKQHRSFDEILHAFLAAGSSWLCCTARHGSSAWPPNAVTAVWPVAGSNGASATRGAGLASDSELEVLGINGRQLLILQTQQSISVTVYNLIIVGCCLPWPIVVSTHSFLSQTNRSLASVQCRWTCKNSTYSKLASGGLSRSCSEYSRPRCHQTHQDFGSEAFHQGTENALTTMRLQKNVGAKRLFITSAQVMKHNGFRRTPR